MDMFCVTFIKNGLEIDLLGGIPFLGHIVGVPGRTISRVLAPGTHESLKLNSAGSRDQ